MRFSNTVNRLSNTIINVSRLTASTINQYGVATETYSAVLTNERALVMAPARASDLLRLPEGVHKHSTITVMTIPQLKERDIVTLVSGQQFELNSVSFTDSYGFYTGIGTKLI
jgi:hypothetical protein